jgi:hypothetical protein
MAARKRRRKTETLTRKSGIRVSVWCPEYVWVVLLVLLLTH